MVAICKLGILLSLESEHAGTLTWDSQPSDCERINVCCSSRPVCGIVLWQLELRHCLSLTQGAWAFHVGSEEPMYSHTLPHTLPQPYRNGTHHPKLFSDFLFLPISPNLSLLTTFLRSCSLRELDNPINYSGLQWQCLGMI